MAILRPSNKLNEVHTFLLEGTWNVLTFLNEMIYKNQRQILFMILNLSDPDNYFMTISVCLPSWPKFVWKGLDHRILLYTFMCCVENDL